MAIAFQSIVIFCFATTLFLSSSAQKCSNYTFSTNRVFSSCSDLPHLDAHLHWNYIPSTKKMEIAYRAPQTSNGWISWGINPTGTRMAGSQALVAFHHSNGSLIAYPTSITSYNPSMQPGALSFPVSNISAEHANNEMTIFAVVGPLKDSSTTINHVWQVGTSVSNNVPQKHPTSGANVQSLGTLDVLSA